MQYLYGEKPPSRHVLVATFDSEEQLLTYVRWATLARHSDRYAFEQGSALAGYDHWSHGSDPLTDDDAEKVPHNPSPRML
jgi:hypothetical protein